MNIPTEPANTPVDDINKAGGHTVDGEGLLNNYAIEPGMYEEDGGLSEPVNSVTVVDIFDSEVEAKKAILEMEQKGLRTGQVSIVAKDYDQELEQSMSMERITAGGGLAAVLTKLGISKQASSQFVNAIEAGKFLVIEIGSDREASQAEHVMEKVGHTIQAS